MLENVRNKLRSLMKLIERKKRNQVYTDFEDELGAETEIEFRGISTAGDFARFKAKALQFLKSHESDPVIRKLRWNEPLRPSRPSEASFRTKLSTQTRSSSSI